MARTPRKLLGGFGPSSLGEREKKRGEWGAKGGLEGNDLKNNFRVGVLLIGRGRIGLNKSSKLVKKIEVPHIV